MSYQITLSAWKGKAVAAAVTLALGFGTSAAFALSLPALGTSPPNSQGTGLVLGIFNTSTNHSEQVNLGYLYSDVTAPGALTPDTLTAPYSLAVNPAGAGSVYQLDFGVIPQFSTLFGTGVGATYMVVSANGTPSTAYQSIFTQAPTSTVPAGYGPSDLATIVNSIGGQGYTGSLGYSASTSTSDANSAISGTFGAGTLGGEGNFAGAVGTALDLWQLGYAPDASFPTPTTFANSQGNGFFFLSSTGDLTWNAPAAPVPLPAAVWLFTSGIAGLGAIARRRRAA